MMTRTCATGALLAALSICGCATTNSPPKNTAAVSPTCLTSTGSRIPPGPNNCSAWGRAYSQTDIDRTGETTVAGALRDLDPSITITH
ncbi:MAG: hypothetical protein ABSG30_18330 [Steroidobacteraceae bacterium]|jgi:hypothetical protein